MVSLFRHVGTSDLGYILVVFVSDSNPEAEFLSTILEQARSNKKLFDERHDYGPYIHIEELVENITTN